MLLRSFLPLSLARGRSSGIRQPPHQKRSGKLLPYQAESPAPLIHSISVFQFLQLLRLSLSHYNDHACRKHQYQDCRHSAELISRLRSVGSFAGVEVPGF